VKLLISFQFSFASAPWLITPSLSLRLFFFFFTPPERVGRRLFTRPPSFSRKHSSSRGCRCACSSLPVFALPFLVQCQYCPLGCVSFVLNQPDFLFWDCLSSTPYTRSCPLEARRLPPSHQRFQSPPLRFLQPDLFFSRPLVHVFLMTRCVSCFFSGLCSLRLPGRPSKPTHAPSLLMDFPVSALIPPSPLRLFVGCTGPIPLLYPLLLPLPPRRKLSTLPALPPHLPIHKEQKIGPFLPPPQPLVTLRSV